MELATLSTLYLTESLEKAAAINALAPAGEYALPYGAPLGGLRFERAVPCVSKRKRHKAFGRKFCEEYEAQEIWPRKLELEEATTAGVAAEGGIGNGEAI